MTPKGPVSIFNLRLPWSVRQKLESESRESGKSMNAIIVELLEKRYEEVEK